MSGARLGRFYSILQTPFDAGGAIDRASLVRLLHHRERCGCDGLFLLGVASEAMFLSRAEQEEIVGLVMRELGGRLPVLAAAYAPATAAVVELGRLWADLGASGVVVLPPYATAPTDDAVVRHYAAVTAALDVPVIAQDEPNTSGVAMSAALLACLAHEVEGVAAFKVEGQPVTQRLSAVRALGWRCASAVLRGRHLVRAGIGARIERHDDGLSLSRGHRRDAGAVPCR